MIIRLAQILQRQIGSLWIPLTGNLGYKNFQSKSEWGDYHEVDYTRI